MTNVTFWRQQKTN